MFELTTLTVLGPGGRRLSTVAAKPAKKPDFAFLRCPAISDSTGKSIHFPGSSREAETGIAPGKIRSPCALRSHHRGQIDIVEIEYARRKRSVLRPCAYAMSSKPEEKIQLEIVQVLLLEIADYSRRLTNEQRALIDPFNQGTGSVSGVEFETR
ncbi:MAG: hypothetical protein ACREIF_08715 [Chthoniobacterales bacterium]